MCARVCNTHLTSLFSGVEWVWVLSNSNILLTLNLEIQCRILHKVYSQFQITSTIPRNGIGGMDNLEPVWLEISNIIIKSDVKTII